MPEYKYFAPEDTKKEYGFFLSNSSEGPEAPPNSKYRIDWKDASVELRRQRVRDFVVWKKGGKKEKAACKVNDTGGLMNKFILETQGFFEKMTIQHTDLKDVVQETNNQIRLVNKETNEKFQRVAKDLGEVKSDVSSLRKKVKNMEKRLHAIDEEGVSDDESDASWDM